MDEVIRKRIADLRNDGCCHDEIVDFIKSGGIKISKSQVTTICNEEQRKRDKPFGEDIIKEVSIRREELLPLFTMILSGETIEGYSRKHNFKKEKRELYGKVYLLEWIAQHAKKDKFGNDVRDEDLLALIKMLKLGSHKNSNDINFIAMNMEEKKNSTDKVDWIRIERFKERPLTFTYLFSDYLQGKASRILGEYDRKRYLSYLQRLVDKIEEQFNRIKGQNTKRIEKLLVEVQQKKELTLDKKNVEQRDLLTYKEEEKNRTQECPNNLREVFQTQPVNPLGENLDEQCKYIRNVGKAISATYRGTER